MIQKITGTDGEERDENARYPQQFPAEQMRKMQLNDTDQELLNRFKQGKYHVLTHPNTRNTLQAAENAQNQIERNVMTKPNLVLEMYFDEENPRYRGGHIPSRVFRILDESGKFFQLFLVVGIKFGADHHNKVTTILGKYMDRLYHPDRKHNVQY